MQWVQFTGRRCLSHYQQKTVAPTIWVPWSEVGAADHRYFHPVGVRFRCALWLVRFTGQRWWHKLFLRELMGWSVLLYLKPVMYRGWYCGRWGTNLYCEYSTDILPSATLVLSKICDSHIYIYIFAGSIRSRRRWHTYMWIMLLELIY